jgi:hypothetical protein
MKKTITPKLKTFFSLILFVIIFIISSFTSIYLIILDYFHGFQFHHFVLSTFCFFLAIIFWFDVMEKLKQLLFKSKTNLQSD